MFNKILNNEETREMFMHFLAQIVIICLQVLITFILYTDGHHRLAIVSGLWSASEVIAGWDWFNKFIDSMEPKEE